MTEQIIPYFPMHKTDRSAIAFEYWQDERSVEMHRHSFYEVFMIARGTSRHYYMGTDTLLVPGDVLIVSPDQPHALSMKSNVSIYNIQFHPDAISPEVLRELEKDSFLMAGKSRVQPDRMEVWHELEISRSDYYKYGELQEEGYEINKNRQGVIHLRAEDAPLIRMTCEKALRVQEESVLTDTLLLLKRRYAEIVFLTIKQAYDSSRKMFGATAREGQRAVSEALLYIEQNIAEKLDFEQLALRCGYSPNHFRTVFRNITGFSPVQYVNRLRVSIAFSLIQEEGLPPSEAALRVGIYDMNYFVRIFKRIMGITPGRVGG